MYYDIYSLLNYYNTSIIMPMYIETIPNRNSPPAVLLRESRREGQKIVKHTLANLSHWDAQLVEHLRVLLKGGAAVPRDSSVFTVERTLPHGHIAAVHGAARLAYEYRAVLRHVGFLAASDRARAGAIDGCDRF